MIKGTFRIGGEVVEVIIKGNDIMFYDTHSQMTTTIDGLRLSKAGVLLEHPDLKDKADWRKMAVERFKAHIKKMESETAKVNYIKEELAKHGYEPLFYQRAGHRPTKWNNHHGI